jgi:hypothetical protein
LNAHGSKDVRLTAVHIAEPFVLDPSSFELEIPIENFKGYESQGIHQIAAELI